MWALKQTYTPIQKLILKSVETDSSFKSSFGEALYGYYGFNILCRLECSLIPR